VKDRQGGVKIIGVPHSTETSLSQSLATCQEFSHGAKRATHVLVTVAAMTSDGLFRNGDFPLALLKRE